MGTACCARDPAGQSIEPSELIYHPRPAEYEVTLKRGADKSYGLYADTHDTMTLYITNLADDGPAMAYNQQVEPELQLARGDFIVEANGVSGDAVAILDKLTNDDRVVLKVRRRIEVTLILDRKKVTNEDGTEGDLQPLGMEWSEHPKAEGLVVMAVNRGLIADWNDLILDPTSKVHVGDCIVGVGSNKGGALNVAKALEEVTGTFQLSLVRAAPVFNDAGFSCSCFSH